jgi:uncharacterized membrane protein
MSTVPGTGGSALPSPEDLKKYDAAHPGLGRQIIEMVQEEQRHLHYVERAEVSLTRRGQLFGFIIAISFLVVSAVLVTLGHTVAGTVIGSVDLVALTTVFVAGRRSQDNSPGPRQVDSTDRLIRELRRAQSGGTKARKPRKREQSTSLELGQATDNPASEPSPGTSAKETQDTAVLPERPNPVGSDACEPPPVTGVDSPAADKNGLDTSPDVAPQCHELTDEDVQLYRRLYNDPDWGPSENQTPLT